MYSNIQIILAIAIAVIGAGWVYNDAKNRGINGFPWALLTFLAVIIGLPFYLLLRPRGELVECPRCNRKKLYSLERCPHCDKPSFSQQTEETRNTPEDTAQTDRNTIGVCDSCGKILETDWKYCPYCGREQK